MKLQEITMKSPFFLASSPPFPATIYSTADSGSSSSGMSVLSRNSFISCPRDEWSAQTIEHRERFCPGKAAVYAGLIMFIQAKWGFDQQE